MDYSKLIIKLSEVDETDKANRAKNGDNHTRYAVYPMKCIAANSLAKMSGDAAQ